VWRPTRIIRSGIFSIGTTFLRLCLGGGSRLGRKLKHRCLLTLYGDEAFFFVWVLQLFSWSDLSPLAQPYIFCASKETLCVHNFNAAVRGIFNSNHNYRKCFLIAFPAVIAGSLLLNDRLICPSTRNRNRSSMGRAWLFCFSAAGCSVQASQSPWHH
jgi:hypothetical protein